MKAAVKHNISDFRDYLKSNDIYMEENIDENNGSVHFSVGLETEAGAKIQLLAAFQNEDPTVDIYCFNVAHVPDATATNDILHVINELNTSYRFDLQIHKLLKMQFNISTYSHSRYIDRRIFNESDLSVNKGWAASSAILLFQYHINPHLNSCTYNQNR